jgi:hypothetical protein
VPARHIIDTPSVGEKRKETEDVIIMGIHELPCRFKPIDTTWQEQHCGCMGLSIIKRPHVQTKEVEMGSPHQVQIIKGDGNCFFRSLAYILSGKEDLHMTVRHSVVQYMAHNENLFKHHVPPGLTVQQYLKQSKMARHGVWSTEAEIFAAAHQLQTDIFTYSIYANGIWKWNKHSGQFVQPGLVVHNRAIYLKDTGSVHYDVVHSVTQVARPQDRLVFQPQWNPNISSRNYNSSQIKLESQLKRKSEQVAYTVFKKPKLISSKTPPRERNTLKLTKRLSE